jgi:CubicO group peptidase (beta-lactamase class C family)
VTEKIDAVLLAAVDDASVPGVVAMAANEDGPTYEGAAGVRSTDASDPITPDTMMRIASMTKMVTTTAALQLVEQDRLDLAAPVDTYLPDFADVPVLDGFNGDAPRLRAPRSRATVHNLVTHTTGLGYWFLNADIDRFEQVTGTPNLLAGKRAAMTAPMTSDPGTQWQYGINSDWLGLVVEAISGQPLDEYLAEHVTGPLGMTTQAVRRLRASPVRLALTGPVADSEVERRRGSLIRPPLHERRVAAVIVPAPQLGVVPTPGLVCLPSPAVHLGIDGIERLVHCFLLALVVVVVLGVSAPPVHVPCQRPGYHGRPSCLALRNVRGT